MPITLDQSRAIVDALTNDAISQYRALPGYGYLYLKPSTPTTAGEVLVLGPDAEPPEGFAPLIHLPATSYDATKRTIRRVLAKEPILPYGD